MFLLSCYKASQLIEKSHARKLSFAERLKLSLHNSICKACANYQKQSLIIEKLIKSTPPMGKNLSELRLSDLTKEQMQSMLTENLRND